MMVANLRCMAIDIAAEIESQNQQIDRISCKSISNANRIRSMPMRTTRSSPRRMCIEANKRIECSYRKPRAEIHSLSLEGCSMTERLDLPESDGCQTQEVKPTKKSHSLLRSKLSGLAQWFSRKFKRKMCCV